MFFQSETKLCCLILGCSLGFLSSLHAGIETDALRLDSAGARAGFSAESRSESFHQAEAFLNCDLPWALRWAEDWRLQTRFDFAAGWLGGHSENAFVGSGGPTLELSYDKFPLTLEGGSGPTYISRYEFGRTDLGSLAQFTSHAQINWNISDHFQILYRFQHMSNAGLSSHNPGLNLHMFGIGYRF